jgi:hypothetical protein
MITASIGYQQHIGLANNSKLNQIISVAKLDEIWFGLILGLVIL